MLGVIYDGFYDRGMNEMLAQMGDVFEKDFFQAERDVIDQYQMLVNLPHVANMRHDFQPEFFCQQTYCQEFTDTANAGTVNLNKGCRAGLDKVFKYNPVGDMPDLCG